MAGVTAITNQTNQLLDKIQSFFNESGYNEMTKNTAKYNMTIRKDRVYRQPYIDGQTGIAQKHCHLFVSDKQRMPGILQGQVYTYPARRWRSTHKSYLATFLQTPRVEPEEHTITTVENPAVLAGAVTNVPEEIISAEKSKLITKPSSHNKGGLNSSIQSFVPDSMEPWFYEENTFEEDIDDEFESEEDFEDETYCRKGSKRRKTPGRKPKGKPKKKSTLKAPARLIRSIKKDENDTENKPYVCELCGMRYKTRPGLTYHYAHSHREEDDDDKAKPGVGGPPKPTHHVVTVDPPKTTDPLAFPNPPPVIPPPSSAGGWVESNGIADRNRRGPPPMLGGNGAPMIPSTVPVSTPSQSEGEKDSGKKRVPPSPYCDFCLGDSTENKKTGQSEQLVSCADCGRSGHPSCLQFTDNMMKSVLRYRWQCIECKTCTLCGTSENDDQLLFCDDCDRGYHLYCLNPPLSEPPEGEWSCSLCIKEFHNK